jgi:hypothetical protein
MAKRNSYQAPQQEAPLPGLGMPSYFDRALDSLEGFEQINQRTMAIPFVRILQKLNPQIDEHRDEFIEGAEEGMWYNTVTKRLHGAKIEVICGKFEQIYIEWRPNRGGFVGYHDPENARRLATESKTVDDFGKWKTPEGNLLQENYVYYCIEAGREKEGIFIISLASSMIGVARVWNRLLTSHVMSNGEIAAPYYLVWELSTTYRENAKGGWYVPALKFVRYVLEPELLAARAERKALPSRPMPYAQLQQEEESGGEAPDAEQKY